jgi:hypothetical protein
MITLTQPTENFLPAFNRINFEISSDNATATGFKYAIKIYNADTSTLVTTAYYDVAVSPFSAESLPQTGEYVYNENILNRFYLKCYEYYDVLGNGIYEIDLTTEVVSNTYTCFAGSFNFFDRPEWNPNDYNGTASSYYPLTDQLQFQLHKNFFKVFTFYNPNNVIDHIIVERVNTTGTTSTTTTPPSNVGGYDLTHFTFKPVDFGATDQTLYFNIYVEYTNGLGTNTNKFSIVNMYDCRKYETKNIVWVNRFGALDSYSFILANRKQTQVERKQYQKDYSGYGQNFVDPYNIFENTSPTYYTKEIQSITINTDYITDRESVVFRQLYSSPLIYLFASGDYFTFNTNNQYPDRSFVLSQHSAFLPVKLKADTYEIKQKENEKLFQIEAQFEYSEPSFRQIV